ncbi:VOC family protein [Deinococcus hohokamensis]|uniref:VOC family protein n=1 Tax=Deinococcus hohokamensis TaxID=309883 RepID=A0ABV9I609_9DEIO
MTQSSAQPSLSASSGRLPRQLDLGPVDLSVRDLSRSVAFYREVLGMAVLEQAGEHAVLGAGTQPLLQLTGRPGAHPSQPRSPGLYHFAVLLPTRSALARWVQHAAATGLRVGQSDHLVSEAFYLSDPDGHGIEVYRDRPRSEWQWNLDQVRMASDPIDIPGLLAEPGAQMPFEGLPEGTVMGHVHLRVTDLAATETFYREVLGFDVVARWPGALFVSVGGYHHHFGLNAWESQGGRPAGEDTARLEAVHLTLPDAAVEALAARLQAAGVTVNRPGAALEVRDPSGNRLIFAGAS